jgi:hypothetical protein
MRQTLSSPDAWPHILPKDIDLKVLLDMNFVEAEES